MNEDWNPDSIAVIGDVHGCYDTLMALIEKLPHNIPLCFVGDLIDRGPKCKEVIDFVMNGDHYCVRGNHEEMLLATLDPHYGSDYMFVWKRNGGTETLRSYSEGKVSDMHMNFLQSLPLYLEFPHLSNHKNRTLLVSHTSIARLWSFLKQGEPYHPDVLQEICWTRDPYPPDIQGKFNVYGHTPVQKPVVKTHFANIDTACCYTWGKKMTALIFPEMEIIQQECIDDIVTRL